MSTTETIADRNLPEAYKDLDNPEPKQTQAEVEKQCELIPMPGRCIFQKEKAATKIGSIILPETARRIPTIGRVVAVGDTDREILVGKRMIIGHMSGVPIYIKDKPQYSICVYEELLAEVRAEGEIDFEPEDTKSFY